MSADIKAATEWAKHFQSGEAYPLTNLAAAFIEVEEGLRAEKLAHEKSNRVQIQLQAELEQERKARENARGAELQWEKMYYEQFEHATDLQAWLGRVETGPTVAECEAAGRGPEQTDGKYSEGGLPNTPEERARFEAYLRGHCWAVGAYDEVLRAYDTTLVRMLYGVWRDRGLLAIRALAAAGGQTESAATQSGQFATKSDSKESPIGDSAPAADPIVAHSKSMYRRLSTQGANVVPPADPALPAFSVGLCPGCGQINDHDMYLCVQNRIEAAKAGCHKPIAPATAGPDTASTKNHSEDMLDMVPASSYPTFFADAEALRIEGLELAAKLCESQYETGPNRGAAMWQQAWRSGVMDTGDAIHAEIARRTK